MPMKSPNLDDRSFADLLEAAKLRIKQHCPEWNDLSPSDPGIVLLEAFSFLTETMIYRLNQIPDKAYIEFLKLIGVKLAPPSSAQVILEFSINKPVPHTIEIPKTTRVTTANSAPGTVPPIFTLASDCIIPAGETSIQATAYHCDYIEAELIGKGTGLPGLCLNVKKPPVISPTLDKLDLIVAVETEPSELETHAEAIKYQQKTYRIWREVDNFTHCENTPFVYTTDRHAGSITFAPSIHKTDAEGLLQPAPEALAQIPSIDCEIRVWYRHGGGTQGNVASDTLTILKDPIVGVSVTNPSPATGGRDSESLDNALIRGPQDLHSLSRAVTARDFELVAIKSSGAVSRAKAYTQASLWKHATPGTVELTLVPEINVKPNQLKDITAENLNNHHLDSVQNQIISALDDRRPLGTHCVVDWAHYKKVKVKAKAVVRHEEDLKQVQTRIVDELYRNICPIALTPRTNSPWPFGQSLKAWDVYKIIGSEPSVLSVEDMHMIVDEVPEKDIQDICIDSFQENTWYTGCLDKVFRSTNNGDSWELISHTQEKEVKFVKAFPATSTISIQHSGLLAVLCQSSNKLSTIQVSNDCGQIWATAQNLQFKVEDIAWLDRDGLPYLLLATEKGLYELSLDTNAVPIPIRVDANQAKLGFRAISISSSSAGQSYVAVAGYDNKGVYISSEGGKTDSFHNIGLSGELIETLAVQHKGPHRYVWAGIGAPGSDQGKGCYRLTLSESAIKSKDWKLYADNWSAGGCKSLAFQNSMVLAATYKLGVLRLDSDLSSPAWKPLKASECGLPLREVGKLETITCVSAENSSNVIMAGSTSGVYRSIDAGLHYSKCSNKEFKDEVKIPSNWLLYSGDHEIEIVCENETSKH